MGPAEFSAQFQVLDIDTSYNLLLGRPFIHMAGDVPSTLHQMMKLVWRNEELVIHGEGSHFGRQYAEHEDLREGICDLFEEIDAIVEKEVELTGIRDAESGDVLRVGDMQGLSTDVVSHKLPINLGFGPVKQKTWKFKPELSLKIKKEITKQIESHLVEVTQYPTWLANGVLVAKKDGKIRICVDYSDLNKSSSKDNLSLPNIHIFD
ncbi:uncharacterized protein [Solanum lycopersicum]|uniref:uncharacterized protein n=1 Tax=Solanum lycopersicum TaxID=4081 RepID=UPI003747C01A